MDNRNEAVPTSTEVTFPNVAGSIGWGIVAGSQQTINIYSGPPYSAPRTPPPKDVGALDWLHNQVDEVCALGRAA